MAESETQPNGIVDVRRQFLVLSYVDEVDEGFEQAVVAVVTAGLVRSSGCEPDLDAVRIVRVTRSGSGEGVVLAPQGHGVAGAAL